MDYFHTNTGKKKVFFWDNLPPEDPPSSEIKWPVPYLLSSYSDRIFYFVIFSHILIENMSLFLTILSWNG